VKDLDLEIPDKEFVVLVDGETPEAIRRMHREDCPERES
jgi:hypothetical protein